MEKLLMSLMMGNYSWISGKHFLCCLTDRLEMDVWEYRDHLVDDYSNLVNNNVLRKASTVIIMKNV
jgi:hypothetical protein